MTSEGPGASVIGVLSDMELDLSNTVLAGDPRLIDHIVGEVKSQGIFDQFRKECIADVDTKVIIAIDFPTEYLRGKKSDLSAVLLVLELISLNIRLSWGEKSRSLLLSLQQKGHSYIS